MILTRIEPVKARIERFTTRRMTAERLTSIHYPEVRSLHLHPQVMKTLSPDGQILPDNVTKDGLAQNDAHWIHHGFGLWIFRAKEDGCFVGRGGLQQYLIDDQEVVGLAYAVMFDYWNRGLATEIAAASLDIGFRLFGFTEVESWTLPSNVASRRVMEKVGFRFDTDIVLAGLPHRLYRLTALDWQMGRGR
jgi:[ribosomal protein S5]-alanine N-acetyltransferase